MLCCDDGFGEMMSDTLAHHELDVISDYSRLKSLSDMYAIFQHDSYDLLILTSLGIPSALAMRHVSMLPDVRTYRVILLSGHLTEERIQGCARREVDARVYPTSSEEILRAIDGPEEPARKAPSSH